MDSIVANIFHHGNGLFHPVLSRAILLIPLQGPLVGAIYDHHGPRWLLIIGSFLHVFGIMMVSLGTEYYQIILAQGLCSAIGVSAIFQPCMYP